MAVLEPVGCPACCDVVEGTGGLVDLEDVGIGGQLLAGIDGKGDDKILAVLLDEVGQGGHELRVERAYYHVAPRGRRVLQYLVDMAVFGQVPGMDVDGDAFFLKRVAGHEDATVVLHHAAPVVVHLVQGQHHA